MLLGLSGGFDSAVVLGCLSHSPARPRITCLNQFAAASHEDEREYARAAAVRAGVTLLEVPMGSAADRFDSRLLLGTENVEARGDGALSPARDRFDQPYCGRDRRAHAVDRSGRRSHFSADNGRFERRGLSRYREASARVHRSGPRCGALVEAAILVRAEVGFYQRRAVAGNRPPTLWLEPCAS